MPSEGCPGWLRGKETHLPMQEAQVRSLSRQDSPRAGKGNATHSSVLAWEILWTEEPGRLICGFTKSQT